MTRSLKFVDTVRDELAGVESGLRSLTGKSVLNGIDSVQVSSIDCLPEPIFHADSRFQRQTPPSHVNPYSLLGPILPFSLHRKCCSHSAIRIATKT